MVTLVLPVVAAGAGALGYFVRVLVERYHAQRRERVLLALGGKLPEWEEHARELEAQGHYNALHQEKLHSAEAWNRFYQKEADITRSRGRKRDREWR